MGVYAWTVAIASASGYPCIGCLPLHQYKWHSRTSYLPPVLAVSACALPAIPASCNCHERVTILCVFCCRYCGVLSLVFLVSGLVICCIRDLLPDRYGRYAPSPMGMAFSFYIGANNAIDFWLGSMIMLVWERRRKQAALQLGPLVGAGLIVGDGLWAIPSALLAIAGVTPPLCLKLS
eukprot:GHUV01024835.1.p1 GENE.GHUV01024835.1~~GHUV01024835.1.p1  ORF type:complete len:178 (-),score=17.76 GHUV01024835.1:3-536(-)